MLIDDLTITSNMVRYSKLKWLYFILIWLSIFPTSLLFMIFFYLFSLWIPTFLIIILLPITIVIYLGAIILFLLLFGKSCLIILNLIHKPKEGVFELSLNDKDFKFFVLRRNLKSFILKMFNYFPLPWVKIFALKTLGIKIPYNSGILDSYIDSDFVEIGNNVILGEGSIIMSSMLIKGVLLVKKVIIRNNCTIGALSIISPGTIVGEGTILGMGSYTKINQILHQNSIYIGRPAKKSKEIE